MFTQQHHEAVARVMRAQLEHTTRHAPGITGPEAIVYTIYVLAGMFYNDNTRFELRKFQSACGLAVKEQI